MTHIGECQLTSDDANLKQKIFSLLDKNHDLSPSMLCRLVGVDHKKYAPTIRNYKYFWRMSFKIRQPLKCLNYHNVRGWIYSLKSMDRTGACFLGWRKTKAKNHMIIWKDKIGRMEWHVTGRINFWVKKPFTKGRIKQLLANGFYKYGVIDDIQMFDKWAGFARLKGAHLVYDTGERLPSARIDLLKESMGVIVKMGDLSHPTGLEIEFAYPDFAEKNELMFARMENVLRNFGDQIKDLSNPKAKERSEDHFMIR